MSNSLIFVIERKRHMRGKQNHIGLYILLGLVLSASILSPKMIAFAGDINSNEARVIAAASGTFSYEGKTYRAGSNYINSLTAYLSADDVDLTAEQADEAISMMYANIADGIAQGYLYEVGGEDSAQGTEDTSEESTSEEYTSEKNPSEKNKEESEIANEEEKAPSSTADKDVDVWDAMSNETENKQKLKQRPEKKDAAASVILQEDDIVVITKDQEELSISKEKKLLPTSVQLVINGISVLMLAITLVCGVILFMTKCMSFRRPKHRRARPGHSKRRKIRRHTRNTLTVTTAVSLLGVFLLLGIYISLFNKEAIMQSMQSSGYFRYAYSEYITDMAKQAADDLVSGKGLSNTEDIQTYEEYLFTIKQNSLKILEGHTETPIPDSNVTPYIYNMKISFMNIFMVSGVCMGISVILGIILMIFMDQRRERGIKHTAVAELTASVVMIVLTAVMAVNKPYLHFYVEPDYLYLFLMEYIQWSVRVMTSVTAFGVVVGMILIGVFKTINDSRTDE